MRTTIDLPPDLHIVLTSLAAANRKSLSQTAVELLHRGLDSHAGLQAPRSKAGRLDRLTGLPTVRLSRPISAEDIRALDDEA